MIKYYASMFLGLLIGCIFSCATKSEDEISYPSSAIMDQNMYPGDILNIKCVEDDPIIIFLHKSDECSEKPE